MNNVIRSVLIGTLAAVAGVASAQQQDYSKVEIKVTKVSGSVYMLEGAAAPSGVVGEEASRCRRQFAPLADKIRAARKGSPTTARS